MLLNPDSKLYKGHSVFGEWAVKHDLPVFNYTANPLTLKQAEWDPIVLPKTRRQPHVIGNTAIKAVVDNMGTATIFTETEVMRYFVSPDHQKGGSGVTFIELDGEKWGTTAHTAPKGAKVLPQFGPQFFAVQLENKGISVDREMIMPEGDVSWVFVRIRVSADEAKSFKLSEEWALSPLYLQSLTRNTVRKKVAEMAVSYEVELAGQVIKAQEAIDNDLVDDDEADGEFAGAPVQLMLESLGGAPVELSVSEDKHPTLTISTDVELSAGETKEFYFRFGLQDNEPVEAPETFFDSTIEAATSRMVKVDTEFAPEAAKEIMWHSAAAYGHINRDDVIGGYTLNQAGNYGFHFGINAAARDPFLDSIPMMYVEPKLGLQVLRNTCAWADEEGALPFGLQADKVPESFQAKPSDMNLYALWAASEYAAITGDLAAFDEILESHPEYDIEPLTLKGNLLRQYDYFHNVVGRGLKNHVRVMTGDWQDVALLVAGDHAEEMIKVGTSVLNTAAASFILPRWAALLEKFGEVKLAKQARDDAEDLAKVLREGYNGKWFDRIYGPEGLVSGRDEIWSDVNGMALTSGVPTPEQAKTIIEAWKDVADTSPLGVRAMWPHNNNGEEAYGGIWVILNMFITTGAMKYDLDFAVENFRKNMLTSHTRAYPAIWAGVLGGPDCWNSQESRRPGHSWGAWGEDLADQDIADDDPEAGMSMMSAQSFPTGNPHTHTALMLSYIRLAGIDIDSEGAIVINKGIGSFESKIMKVNKDGSGWIKAEHEITVKSVKGTFTGKGLIRF